MLNGLPWKWTEIILSFLRLHPIQLGCFQVLTITNKADINIQVHVFPWLFPLGKHQEAWLLVCKVRTSLAL